MQFLAAWTATKLAWRHERNVVFGDVHSETSKSENRSSVQRIYSHLWRLSLPQRFWTTAGYHFPLYSVSLTFLKRLQKKKKSVNEFSVMIGLLRQPRKLADGEMEIWSYFKKKFFYILNDNSLEKILNSAFTLFSSCNFFPKKKSFCSQIFSHLMLMLLLKVCK